MADAETRLSALLHEAVPPAPRVLSADAVIENARRRRVSHLIAPIAAAAAVVMIAVVGYAVLAGMRGDQRPTALSGPARPRPPATSSATARDGTGCPKTRALPAGTGIAIDYVDFLYMYRRIYVASPPGTRVSPRARARLGTPVGVVTCTIGKLSDGRREIVGPYLEGNAAVLPTGTPIYGLRAYPAACRLAVIRAGRLIEYRAQRDVHGHPVARECRATPRGR